MKRIAIVSSRGLPLLALTLLSPPHASAQVEEPPVLYDTDLPSADFHRGRREALVEAMPDDGVAVLFGAPERNRSNDVDFEYRQSSDMLYLTGLQEPGGALLLAPGGMEVDGRTVREVLFVLPRDPGREVWLGRRLGPSGAEAALGVEMALPVDRFEEVSSAVLESGRRVFHAPLPSGVAEGSTLGRQLEAFRQHVQPLDLPGGVAGFVLRAALSVRDERGFQRAHGFARQALKPADLEPELRELAQALVEADTYEAWDTSRGQILAGRPDGVLLRGVLDGLRMVKTDDEMTLLRKAVGVTADAHRAVLQQVEPGWAEYEIEALVEYTFKREGAEHPGFPSIVGSGENSVILHYESNRRVTQPGDVVVIDIGAEYHGYSADVTRTVPVSGRFSPEQRRIYELVYRAQEAGIEAARAGRSFSSPHEAAAHVLAEGLAELGLTDGPEDRAGLRRFFMHGTSHYLGLDVHDVGDGGPLEPGVVLTVEPGIYIAPAADVDPRWWNIGVRIEDDVLVTDGDPEVLSAAAPRAPDDVEGMMRGRPVR